MEQQQIEIKQRAQKILENIDISTLKDENSIMQILLNIVNSDTIEENCNKTLNFIEDYLITKEKMKISKEDTSSTNLCFLKKKEIEEYIKNNKLENKEIELVQESKNIELVRLLEIIQRNF